VCSHEINSLIRAYLVLLGSCAGDLEPAGYLKESCCFIAIFGNELRKRQALLPVGLLSKNTGVLQNCTEMTSVVLET